MENFQHDIGKLRRVFFIDVDTMSEDEIFEHLENIKAAMKIEYFAPSEKSEIVTMLLDNAIKMSDRVGQSIDTISKWLEENATERPVSESR